MAGVGLSYDVTKISAGRKVDIFYGCAIPAAGAVLALDAATQTPDLTANPNAKHLGMTDKGVTLTARGNWQDFKADELPGAIKTVFSESEMKIEADILQIEDFNILQLLSSGFGTLTTPSTPVAGSRLGFGISSQAYSSIVALWALEADPTKTCIFHLFRAANKTGITFNKSRNDKSTNKVEFMGYDVPGRAITEVSGYVFIPTAS